jgi:hypothetical protein
MIDPPVPAWKKWLMLAAIVGFVLLLALVAHLRRSARDWAAEHGRPVPVRPAR